MKIYDVKIVSGTSLFRGWKSNMQKIITDEGIFVDNIIHTSPIEKWDNRKGQPGYDWTTLIGAEVKPNVDVTWSKHKKSGINWLHRR